SIDIEKIGFHVRAFIQVQLEPRQKDEFYPYVQSIPNVVECNCVTGDYSEIMEVIFPSTTDLDNFINTIQQRFGKTSTQIVFSTSVQHRGITLDDANID
ncbi:Lrp/AsnC family transcriptional regulator, partial [Lactobacillus crispatus]